MIDFPAADRDADGLRDRRLRRRLGHLVAPLPASLSRVEAVAARRCRSRAGRRPCAPACDILTTSLLAVALPVLLVLRRVAGRASGRPAGVRAQHVRRQSRHAGRRRSDRADLERLLPADRQEPAGQRVDRGCRREPRTTASPTICRRRNSGNSTNRRASPGSASTVAPDPAWTADRARVRHLTGLTSRTESRRSDRRSRTAARSPASRRTRRSRSIKGPPGSQVSAGGRRRSGRDITPSAPSMLTRATISEPVVASATRTVHGVKLGVVALATFSPGAHAEVREAVEHELEGRRTRDRVRPSRQRRRPRRGGAADREHLHHQGHDRLDARAHAAERDAHARVGDAISPAIPVVVLVDSQHGLGRRRSSRRRSRTITARRVVGTHTFGKGVFQEEQPLSNGGALDITVGEYFTPNGRNLGGGGVKQGAGITPEVRRPTRRRQRTRPRSRAEHARGQSAVSRRAAVAAGLPAGARAVARAGGPARATMPESCGRPKDRQSASSQRSRR